jgi:hypothetical protein
MSVIETLISEIDEYVLFEKIDAPLNRCFESFSIDQPKNLTHKQFNAVITAFYQHLNLHGLTNPRRLSSSEAFSEVLWILERHYRGPETTGYDGAFLDALNQGQEGLRLTVERILQIIKSEQRKHYISWVIQSTIDPSDWNAKKKLVEDLIYSYGHLLHPDVKKLTAAQLIPHLEALITRIAQPFPHSSPIP